MPELVCLCAAAPSTLCIERGGCARCVVDLWLLTFVVLVHHNKIILSVKMLLSLSLQTWLCTQPVVMFDIVAGADGRYSYKNCNKQTRHVHNRGHVRNAIITDRARILAGGPIPWIVVWMLLQNDRLRF